MRAAIIENGVCKNTIVVHELADVPGCVALPDGFGVGDLFDGQTWTSPELEPEQPTVPAEVTMRQARMALIGAGKLAQVDAAIASMQEPQRTAATIEWEYSNALQRSNPFVSQLGAALGLDAAAIDALFVEAAKL